MVRTSLNEFVFGDPDAPGAQETLRELEGVHLLNRLAKPEEIGNAAQWLLSDESSFVTGALIPVEGGATAGRRVATAGERVASSD